MAIGTIFERRWHRSNGITSIRKGDGIEGLGLCYIETFVRMQCTKEVRTIYNTTHYGYNILALIGIRDIRLLTCFERPCVSLGCLQPMLSRLRWAEEDIKCQVAGALANLRYEY